MIMKMEIEIFAPFILIHFIFVTLFGWSWAKNSGQKTHIQYVYKI